MFTLLDKSKNDEKQRGEQRAVKLKMDGENEWRKVLSKAKKF